jgi:hypothetical protein
VTNAIQQGHSVIIENVTEDIDATLDPVLARAVYKKGRTFFLQVCAACAVAVVRVPCRFDVAVCHFVSCSIVCTLLVVLLYVGTS